MLRAWWALAASVAAVVVGVACSSSDGSSSSSSGGASSGGTSSAFHACPPANAPSSCTQADLTAYANCSQQKCDAQYKQCFGASYAQGTFGGPCGTYQTCIQKCSCGDTTCTTKCGAIPAACSSCQASFTSCSQSCTLPACFGTGSSSSSSSSGSSSSSSSSGSSGPHTCAQLATCCAKITDPSEQTQCNKIAQSDAGSDTACDIAYDSFASQATGGCN